MATNSHAEGYGPGQVLPDQSNVEPYLKQTSNPSYMGAANNMVRALLQGYGEYKKAHPATQPVTGASPGPPLPLTPQVPAWPPTGGAVPYSGNGPLGAGVQPPSPTPMPAPMQATGGVPYAGLGPMGTGTDPMTQAMFTPPPQSPWGGGSQNATY